MTHGEDVSIWTLSPSDEEYDTFLLWIAANMPSVGETRRVATKRLRNDLSVAVQLAIGDDHILFGGDLEEEGKPSTGWSAILASKGRPAGKASLFKVSHHGSETGDHPQVWTQMLASEPVAIVAPFRNGNVSLPKKGDVDRLLAYTQRSYIGSTLKSLSPPLKDHSVQKMIDQVTRNYTTLKPAMGLVRARKRVGSHGPWSIELFGDATHLKNAR